MNEIIEFLEIVNNDFVLKYKNQDKDLLMIIYEPLAKIFIPSILQNKEEERYQFSTINSAVVCEQVIRYIHTGTIEEKKLDIKKSIDLLQFALISNLCKLKAMLGRSIKGYLNNMKIENICGLILEHKETKFILNFLVLHLKFLLFSLPNLNHSPLHPIISDLLMMDLIDTTFLDVLDPEVKKKKKTS